MIARKSPLGSHAAAGRYGNREVSLPGVELAVIPDRDIVRVGPFSDKRNAASAALRKTCKLALPAIGRSSARGEFTVAWAALDAWFVMTPGTGRGELLAKLNRPLRASASLVDVSHGLTGLRVDGHRARDLLAKGCAVDLEPSSFAVGACAATRMEHTAVHLRRTGENAYELFFPTSLAVSFWHFLTEMALEFGYEVRDP